MITDHFVRLSRETKRSVIEGRNCSVIKGISFILVSLDNRTICSVIEGYLVRLSSEENVRLSRESVIEGGKCSVTELKQA